MSELSVSHADLGRIPHWVKATAAACAAMVALSACSQKTVDAKPSPGPSAGIELETQGTMLERCFDAPQPPEEILQYPEFPSRDSVTSKKPGEALEEYKEKVEHYDSVMRPEPLELRQTEYDEIVGDPSRLEPEIHDKVRGSAIRIDNSGHGIMSSGFIHESGAIVTAAHSVHGTALQNILITDNYGQSSTVVDGCFMYEEEGALDEPSGMEIRDIDLAVLVPERSLGSATLSLSVTKPQRGEWVTFMNFQDSLPAQENPAEYTGITLTHPEHYYQRTEVLTGIQSWRDCEPKPSLSPSYQCTIEPGASGGPVVEWSTGNVIGISTDGTNPDIVTCLNESDLDFHDVSPEFEISEGTGHCARVAGITDAEWIDLALSSPELTDK